jgi:hypothetical protein
LLSTVTSTNGGFAFSWAASGVGFSIYMASTLVPPINWTLLTNQAVLNGTQWNVDLPHTSAASFYRLQSP